MNYYEDGCKLIRIAAKEKIRLKENYREDLDKLQKQTFKKGIELLYKSFQDGNEDAYKLLKQLEGQGMINFEELKKKHLKEFKQENIDENRKEFKNDNISRNRIEIKPYSKHKPYKKRRYRKVNIYRNTNIYSSSSTIFKEQEDSHIDDKFSVYTDIDGGYSLNRINGYIHEKKRINDENSITPSDKNTDTKDKKKNESRYFYILILILLIILLLLGIIHKEINNNNNNKNSNDKTHILETNYEDSIDSNEEKPIKINFNESELYETSTMLKSIVYYYSLDNNGELPSNLSALVGSYPYNYITNLPYDPITYTNTYVYKFTGKGGWVYYPKSDGEYLMDKINSSFKPNVKIPKDIEKKLNEFYPVEIVIDRSSNKLYLFNKEKIFRIYDVGLGKESTPTPLGSFSINEKIAYPRRDLGPNNVYGTRALELNAEYAIHGTNDPSSINNNKSHGCIRMNNSDVEELYAMVGINTPVNILPSIPSSSALGNLIKSSGANSTNSNPNNSNNNGQGNGAGGGIGENGNGSSNNNGNGNGNGNGDGNGNGSGNGSGSGNGNGNGLYDKNPGNNESTGNMKNWNT